MWVVTAKEPAEPSDLRGNLSPHLGIPWKVAEGREQTSRSSGPDSCQTTATS